MHAPRIVSIPPGADFLATLADTLLDGRLIPGLSFADAPLALASATIYLPTRRAIRALETVFVDRLGGGTAILPRMVPLGLTDESETSLLLGADAPPDTDTSILPGIGDLQRRLLLTEMVLDWARKVERAIVSVDEHGRRILHATEALLVGTQPADAFHLAGELAGLIDEFFIEGVAWRALEPLGIGAHDRYWGITLDFLDIAMRAWPEILAASGLIDVAARRVRLIEKEIDRLRAGTAGGPLIVAGSTGTNRATADLMAAIARAPHGAVVLPGLEPDTALGLDEAAWNSIGRDTAAGHPQAALHRLLPRLGVSRADVQELGHRDEPRVHRSAFMREALRPAATTAAWQTRAQRLSDADMASALEEVGVIEARDERAEALALALVLREAIEVPGRTSALITPDRGLARRVAAELRRWGIEVGDSAGVPLARSPVGVLARLVAACAAGGREPLDVAALLAHPLARLGLAPADLQRVAAALQVGVLRTPSASIRDVAAQIEAARAAAGETHAHPAVRAIKPEMWARISGLLLALQRLLGPLAAIEGAAPLGTWIEAHRNAVLAVVAGAEAAAPPRSADMEVLQDLFDESLACSSETLRLGCEDYRAFFDRLAAETPVREAGVGHPRCVILGLLEARLLAFDVVALGGLDETIWPPPAKLDAFLNRPMRDELGLSPPERRIGQTAHDFAQALGAGRVVLSRALKRGGSPTVASRLLQRMAAVAGEELWRRCRADGARYLAWADGLESAPDVMPVRAPEPRPKVELRPHALSVTEIETLRRDPYSIYAKHILKLKPLEVIGPDDGAREFGNRMHQVLSEFTARFSTGHLPLTVEHELEQQARETFAEQLGDPDFLAIQWPRIKRSLRFYLSWERARRYDIGRIHSEIRGTLSFPLQSGATFKLVARADRLEIGFDGALTVVDYKTGSPPSPKVVAAGFSPQLTLEAVMANRGAFRAVVETTPMGNGIYVRLGTRGVGGEVTAICPNQGEFALLAERHWCELVKLLDAFELQETHYCARPFPQYALAFGDYDHLARVREWATGDMPGEDAP